MFSSIEVCGVETLCSQSFFCPLDTLFVDCYETLIVSPSRCSHPAFEFRLLLLRRKETNTLCIACWNLGALVLLGLWQLLVFFYDWRRNAFHYVLPQIP